MNGYNDIIAEPSAEDEDLAMACGFEVISEDELYDMLSMSFRQPPSSSVPSSRTRGNSSGKLSSISTSSSRSSFVSATSSGFSSFLHGGKRRMPKPMSSCSLSSHGSSEMSEEADDYSSAESGGLPEMDHDHDDEDNQDQYFNQSVERLWTMIQKKRHFHHYEEELRMELHHPQFLTMELTSNSHNRLTAWIDNLIHFPEKLRQIQANKHRFNINKVPQEVRDELKHIYVY